MKASNTSNAVSRSRPGHPAQRGLAARPPLGLESLEGRTHLAAAAWGYWPTFLGMDKVFQNYPWLDGGGNNIAIVDKGIDYWHPALGGNRATSTKSPKIVNVYDYRDNDTNPFPSESEATDPSSAHGTGVAGILVANQYTYNGKRYQGILQDSRLYNLRTNRFDSQNTIKQALAWVVANHAQYNITAVNLTDFIGTSGSIPVYQNEIKALWDAGIFVATPVANDWMDPVKPKQAIGLPASSPYIFGTGGILADGTINPKTQRGPGLDLLAPSKNVSLIYYTPSTDQDIYTDFGEGNSWGTPHVLGTAVLIQQIDPTITPAEVMQILKDSGVAVVDPDNTGSYTRLAMYDAINLAYSRRDDVYDQGAGGNDDLAHAALIAMTNDHGVASNLKMLIGDTDYYAFDIATPQDYTITLGFNGDAPFPTAELLDVDGNPIGTIGAGGLKDKRLATGRYYIRVTSDQSLDAAYSLDIGTQAPPPIPGNPGKDGTFNDIAYDASNNLHFAWYDAAAGRLKYAKKTGSTWSSVAIVDDTGGTGYFLSMALDSQGRPGVAYYDSTNGDLKYAKFNGSQWAAQTVDSQYTVGYYPSLKFDHSDRPIIAYYAKSGGNLKFATGGAGGWTLSLVDTGGDVGRYPSLALNPTTGRWAVAYEKTTTGEFRYAQQTKSGWNLTVVDTTGDGGGFISLAFDSANRPAFSYYDAYNANLKYARYNGSRWIASTVAAKNSQGLYTNLFFDPGTNYLPVIYYFNKTSNATMAARSNGTVWEFESLAVGGGRHNRVALNSDSFETFSYLDDASGDVKVAVM